MNQCDFCARIFDSTFALPKICPSCVAESVIKDKRAELGRIFQEEVCIYEKTLEFAKKVNWLEAWKRMFDLQEEIEALKAQGQGS